MESLKPLVKLTIAVSIALTCASCLASRLRRPEITGVVCDYSSKPIEKCSVGEVVTDSYGRFTLKELRYCQFTAPGMEAPPLFIREEVSKEGYHTAYLQMHSLFGGGSLKGAKRNVDTIFLRKQNEILSASLLLSGKWECSASKYFDTLYLVKHSSKWDYSMVESDNTFYEQFRAYRDGGVGEVGSRDHTGNLPDTLRARSYILSFQHGGELEVQKAQAYRLQRANDTVSAKGRYKIDERNTIWLDSKTLNELSGLYIADTVELKWMMLIRRAKD